MRAVGEQGREIQLVRQRAYCAFSMVGRSGARTQSMPPSTCGSPKPAASSCRMRWRRTAGPSMRLASRMVRNPARMKAPNWPVTCGVWGSGERRAVNLRRATLNGPLSAGCEGQVRLLPYGDVTLCQVGGGTNGSNEADAWTATSTA